MACVRTNTQKRKHATFSQAEIEAARQLLQLSSAGSVSGSGDEEKHQDISSSNSYSYSYSVQWKPQRSKADDVSASAAVSLSSTDAIEDVLAEIEEDECLKRKTIRYRYIRDLYYLTQPLPRVPVVKVTKRH